jgi:hypothetical protein
LIAALTGCYDLGTTYGREKEESGEQKKFFRHRVSLETARLQIYNKAGLVTRLSQPW